ncbi:hypothetical protein GCM10020295_56960 [Streptomyces cinereospinus]
MLPGDRYWIAADYKTTADFTGATVKLFLGFYDEAGTRLGSDGIVVSAPVTDGTWQRISKVITIPANSTQANMRVGVDGTGSTVTVGSAYFDNLECRSVLSTPGSGARAELSPQGLRLYDESGGEAVSLTTGTPNYVTLTNNGRAVATIDQEGNTGVADLAVAGTFTIGGDPFETYLASFARGLVAVDYQASSVSAGTTDYGFVELSFDADTSRMYRIVLDCYADPSVAGGELVVALRDGGAKTPSITSPQIQSVTYPLSTAGFQRIRLECIRSGSALGTGLHRLLTTFRCQSGPTGQTVRLFRRHHISGRDVRRGRWPVHPGDRGLQRRRRHDDSADEDLHQDLRGLLVRQLCESRRLQLVLRKSVPPGLLQLDQRNAGEFDRISGIARNRPFRRHHPES